MALADRTKNPLNIRFNQNNDWLGQTGQDSGFSSFADVGFGYRAADRVLNSYGNQGISTVRDTISRFAPPSENDTDNYIDFIAQRTGLNPDDQIDLSNQDTRATLLAAMAKMESNTDITPGELRASIDMAELGRVTPQQPMQSPDVIQQLQDSVRSEFAPRNMLVQNTQATTTNDVTSAINLFDKASNPNRYSGFLEGVRDDDYMDMLGVVESQERLVTAPGSLAATFERGVKAGALGLESDFNYFAALGNTLLGNEDGVATRLNNAKEAETMASNVMEGVESFETFLDEPTVYGFFQQIAGATGQIAPSAVATIGTGLAGAVTGAITKTALNKVTQSTTRKLIEDIAEKARLKGGKKFLTPEEQDILETGYGLLRGTSKAAKTGGVVGALGQEYPMMAGGSFGEFDEAGVELDESRALQSLLTGIPLAAIGVGGEAFILKSLAKHATTRAAKTGNSALKQYAQDIITQGVKSGVIEGGTEVLQEGTMVAQRFATDENYTAEQAQLRLGQAAFAGFFGGKAIGSAGASVTGIFKVANQMVDDATDARVAADIDTETTNISDDSLAGPTPESPKDLDAQIDATANSGSTKAATWLPEGTTNLDSLPENEIVETPGEGRVAYAARIPGRGTIVSFDKDVVQGVLAAGASEESLVAVLGYSNTKPVDADRVVRVTDENGNVVSEEATNAEGEAAARIAAEGIATDNQNIDVVDTRQAQEDRKTRFDDEAREMQLADELQNVVDANPEQDPRNIDADDTGSLPFDPEGPFSDINPQEDRGREPRDVASYQLLQERFKQQTLDDPEYNQRFNLLNQLYEQRGYTEDDGTSVLEKFRGSLSADNLKALGNLIIENSDIATYFPEFRTVDGEQRVVIVEYPTEQGRRRARRQIINPETGQEVEASAVELSRVAVSRAERGAGAEIGPTIPKFRVVNEIAENREVDGETQRVVVGHSPFGDIDGKANNQNVELGVLANEGISINTADQATLVGEGLSRAQQLKLGLVRMLGELAGREKALSFEGTALNIQDLATEAARNVDAEGRYNGTNPVLQAEVKSKDYSDSLGNLLLTPDPRTNAERTAGVKQEQRVNEQLARAEFDEDIGAIRQKYVDEFVRRREEMRAEGRSEREIDLMGASLKSRMATEIAAFTEFDPADIDTAPRKTTAQLSEEDVRQEIQDGRIMDNLFALTDPRFRERQRVEVRQNNSIELDSLNNPEDRAEQEFRQEGGLDQEDEDLFSPRREADPDRKVKTKKINARFRARAARIRKSFEGSPEVAPVDAGLIRIRDRVAELQSDGLSENEALARVAREESNRPDPETGELIEVTVADLRDELKDLEISPEERRNEALNQQLLLNELNRKEELSKLNSQPSEKTKARPSRILLEMQPMPGDRMPGAPLRESDARVLGGASVTPVKPMGANRRAVIRQSRRVKRKTAPTVTLNGNLGTLTSRIANKAMSLFRFSKPIHIFTLSDLKSNWEFYVGGNTTLATGISNTNEYVSGPIFERTNALMEAEGLSRQDAQARVLQEVDALPEAERVTTFRNSELGVKTFQTRAKQELGKGLYAPLAEFLSQTISRMDETQDGVRVPGRMITTGDAHIIVINDTDVQSGTLSDAALGAVLSHEIGHILFKEEMQSLLDKPRGKMLFEAFQRHVEEMGGEVPSQYADAEELMSLGFEEFYADQVAVFLLNESAEADTGAKSYFKQIAKKIKGFMKAVSQILGGRIAQATTTNAQVGVPFRAQREGETDAAYNEAKTAYDNQPFVKTYFDQVVAEHKRKTRELVDEYDEVGWATQHAAREIAIDVRKEIKDRAPGLLDSYKSVVEKILQSGSYKWLSRMLSSVDGWLREQGPEGIAIAQFFYAKSSSFEGVGFHEAKGRKNREFNNRLAGIFGLSIKAEENAWEVPEVEGALELAQDETVPDIDLQRRADAGDTIAANALKVRELFSDIFDEYITNPKTGRPWFAIQKRLNYAPRMWNFVAIQEDPEGFRTLLLKSGISSERIDALLAYVDENETSEDIRLGETEADARLRRELDEIGYQAERLAERRGITIKRAREIINEAKEKARLSPGMDAALSRELAKVSTAAAREAGFMQPAGMAMIQYFHQLTRKVEYERRGGYRFIKSQIDAAPEAIREHLDDAVLAQLGKKGQGMSGGWRLFNSIAAVHTALTTLLFTVFASVTDLAGIGVRLKEFDNVKAFYKEVFSGFKESFTGVGERVQFAQDVGVITMEAMDNMFIAVGELDFANTWARKTMAGFFKYTGLNWYTRATRIMAAGAGRMFLIRTATKKDFGAREARYLQELGLTRDEVLAAYDEKNDHLDIKSNEKIREAVVRFAEESIIRPNPAQRPSWASSPYFTAIWQLKSYFYAYGKTVLGGMGREVKNRYSEDGNFQGGAMLLLMAAGMMLPLTALGLELREYTKWTVQAILPGIDASKRVFRSDYMDIDEYLFEVGIDRSGILGPFTLALTAVESLKWEGPIGPVIANIPFADAIDDVFIDGDYMRTVPVLNNVQ